MPTLGQALQNTPPQTPGSSIRTVVSSTVNSMDVGFGTIPNATGANPSAGRRVVITWCEGVWVAVALLPT